MGPIATSDYKELDLSEISKVLNQGDNPKQFYKHCVDHEIFNVYSHYQFDSIVGAGPFGRIASAYDHINNINIIVK